MDVENKIAFVKLSNRSKSSDCLGVIQWAKTWNWKVGAIVAMRLEENNFSDWETVFVLTVGEQYAGLCILEKTDEWGVELDPALTPFITAVYIDPKFRGKRFIEKLLDAALDFARSLDFDAVYLITGTHGLYEKYGFSEYAQIITRSGGAEHVYKRFINPHVKNGRK